ncbi:MAG: hypothetical protein ACOZNI_02040 [Myxococcota bacterium]
MDVTGTSHVRRLSAKGVLAGAICTTAFGDVLVMLGVAVGLAAFDPGREGWNGVVGAIGGGAYTTLAIVLATLAGAFVSVRTTPDIGRTDGVIQGIVTWAVAFQATMITLLWVSMASSIAGALAAPDVPTGPMPGIVPEGAVNTAEAAAWWFVITGVLGACAGAVGGLAAADRAVSESGRRVVPPIVEGPV